MSAEIDALRRRVEALEIKLAKGGDIVAVRDPNDHPPKGRMVTPGEAAKMGHSVRQVRPEATATFEGHDIPWKKPIEGPLYPPATEASVSEIARVLDDARKGIIYDMTGDWTRDRQARAVIAHLGLQEMP